LKLVVGLGNPGPRYAKMRHNAGFRVIEAFAAKHGVSAWRSRFNAKVAHCAPFDAVLVLPQTFMNDSGDAVASLAHYYKVPVPSLCVVSDDITLPFAHLRMRRGGGSGGHNGLQDIIQALHTAEFPRLRIGVGRPLQDAIDVVLGPFSAAEEAALPEVVERALKGVETFLRDGVDAAIALVNANDGAPPATAAEGGVEQPCEEADRGGDETRRDVRADERQVEEPRDGQGKA
jgi:PTH1 family peptidyl-tRNA hydrolase